MESLLDTRLDVCLGIPTPLPIAVAVFVFIQGSMGHGPEIRTAAI